MSVVPVKSKVKISQSFVAFSEYMNFRCRWQRNCYLIVANKNSYGKCSWFCLIRNNNKTQLHDSNLMIYFFLQVIIGIWHEKQLLSSFSSNTSDYQSFVIIPVSTVNKHPTIRYEIGALVGIISIVYIASRRPQSRPN